MAARDTVKSLGEVGGSLQDDLLQGRRRDMYRFIKDALFPLLLLPLKKAGIHQSLSC